MAGKFLVLWKLELRRATPDVARALFRQQDYGARLLEAGKLRRGITWWVGMVAPGSTTWTPTRNLTTSSRRLPSTTFPATK